MNPSAQEWIVLFGGARREEAVFALVDAGIKVKAVIVPRSQPAALALSIEALAKRGLTIVPTTRDEMDEVIGQFAGAAMLSIGFTYILPASILARHTIRINIHPTLLPAYRGPSAGYYLVANGEKESGSTVHIIEPGMDDGAIVAQVRFPISRFDTVRSVQRKAYALEADLLREAIRKLDAGEVPTPQDESKASIYPVKRVPADSQIDPAKSIEELYDSIRACDPNAYPAFFMVDGQKVAIRLWRPERPKGDEEDML